MRISKIFCILIALLFIVGFAAIGHAEEEGMLSKVKNMFKPETVVDEKDVADAESEIESKQEELLGEESENLEAMESTDVVDAESEIESKQEELFGRESEIESKQEELFGRESEIEPKQGELFGRKSEIESKQKELFGRESEILEAMESTDVAESRDDVTLPHSEQDGEEEVVLKVEGMTCSGCEKKVKTALMNCLDVQDCEVSYINGDATVKVAKGSANTAEMINAVEKTGFSAELKEDIQYGAEPKTKGMGEKEVAEEEGILNKVKEIFKPETAAEEKE